MGGWQRRRWRWRQLVVAVTVVVAAAAVVFKTEDRRRGPWTDHISASAVPAPATRSPGNCHRVGGPRCFPTARPRTLGGAAISVRAPPSGFTFFRPVDSRSFTLNLNTFFLLKRKEKAKQKELFLEPLSSTEAPPPRQAHPWPLCEAARTQRAAIPAGGLARRRREAERVQSAPEGSFSQA
jgi:hypothetical protein